MGIYGIVIIEFIHDIYRLRTGWSVKTGIFESHGWGEYPNSCTGASNRCGQSFLLSEDERQSIIQVNLAMMM